MFSFVTLQRQARLWTYIWGELLTRNKFEILKQICHKYNQRLSIEIVLHYKIAPRNSELLLRLTQNLAHIGKREVYFACTCVNVCLYYSFQVTLFRFLVVVANNAPFFMFGVKRCHL